MHNETPFTVELDQLLSVLRARLNEPGVDLYTTAWDARIPYNTVYRFKVGLSEQPRMEFLAKLARTLLPGVVISVTGSKTARPAVAA